jgi:DNA-binding LytR/AlgR family response regulator
MKRVLIIEDERPAALKLERMLLSVRPDWQVVDKLETVAQAVEWLAANEAPHLILMDIQLSDGVSFEIFEQVKVSSPVIFTTAFDKYAVKAFKVNSIDYLLKPISVENLEAAIVKFEKSNATVNDHTAFENAYTQLGRSYKSRFLVKVGQAYVMVQSAEVEMFYISERSTFIRTFKGKIYDIDYSLDQLQQLLRPEQFFRVNRNCLVNIEAVSKLVSYSSSRLKLVLATGYKAENLVVSRDKVPEFKKWLDK